MEVESIAQAHLDEELKLKDQESMLSKVEAQFNINHSRHRASNTPLHLHAVGICQKRPEAAGCNADVQAPGRGEEAARRRRQHEAGGGAKGHERVAGNQ